MYVDRPSDRDAGKLFDEITPNHAFSSIYCCYFLNIIMADITLNIFVGNTTMLDPEVYQYWLDGYSGKL